MSVCNECTVNLSKGPHAHYCAIGARDESDRTEALWTLLNEFVCLHVDCHDPLEVESCAGCDIATVARKVLAGDMEAIRGVVK